MLILIKLMSWNGCSVEAIRLNVYKFRNSENYLNREDHFEERTRFLSWMYISTLK